MERKRLNKRAQGLSTNAIILIVLGVIILVLLIAGFTIGWANLLPFLSQDNVDTIVRQCETACASSAAFDYCVKERELIAEGDNLTSGPQSCYYLSVSEGVKYGVESCSSLASQCEDLTPTEITKEYLKEADAKTACEDAKKVWKVNSKGGIACDEYKVLEVKGFCCYPN